MLEHPFIDCLCPILPQRRAVQEQERLVKALGMGCVCPGWSWWPRPFLMPCLCKHQWQLLLTAVLPGCWEDSEICGSESPVFLQLSSPLNHGRLCARVKMYPEARGVRVITPFRLRYAGLVGCEKQPDTPCNFNPSSLSKHSPHKQGALSSQAESRLPRAFLLSRQAFQSTKRIYLLWWWVPGIGHPRWAWTTYPHGGSLPFLFFPGDQVQTTSLPFLPYLTPMWIFLIADVV